MSKSLPQDWPVGVKLLSLLVAALLWLGVVAERPGESTFQVPVRPEHIPRGLTVVSPSSLKVEVTVSGPRILLLLLPYGEVSCGLDLSGAVAGTANLTPQEGSFHLPDRELKVVRISRASVVVTLAKTA